MNWRPAAVADSLLFNKCSNAASHPGAAFTFGHGSTASGGGVKAVSGGDLAAAVWWQGGAQPTTNDARNADVAAWWARNKGQAGAAVHDLTGREVARAVKRAGRGAHVDLRCEAAPAKARSLYKDAFCEHHEHAARELGLEQNPAAYAKYCEANAAAKANKALGTGSSVNLSFMW